MMSGCKRNCPTSPQQRLPLHITFIRGRRLAWSDRSPTPKHRYSTRTCDNITLRPVAGHIPKDLL